MPGDETMTGRPAHVLLATTQHPNGRIERRRGSWTYYKAIRNDGTTCSFARKRDAVACLDRLTKPESDTSGVGWPD